MEPVLEHARLFWGETLDLDPIRFVDSGIARSTGRAFVTHNTVHWPGPLPTDPSVPTLATVIHELAHCWQYQTGRWQLTRGLVEQTLYTLFGWWLARAGRPPLYDPYDYGGAGGLASAAGIVSFRLEAQARVIEHYWLSTMTDVPAIRGIGLRDPDGGPTRASLDLERLCVGAGLRSRDALSGPELRSGG